MHSLAAARTASIEPASLGQDLSADELDAISGGLDPLGIAFLVFTGSVIVGVLDRLIFGGCRCQR